MRLYTSVSIALAETDSGVPRLFGGGGGSFLTPPPPLGFFFLHHQLTYDNPIRQQTFGDVWHCLPPPTEFLRSGYAGAIQLTAPALYDQIIFSDNPETK